MINIKEFRINQDLDSLNNVKKIKDSINTFVNDKPILNLSRNLSNILEIPEEILKKKLKQVLYSQFDYYNKTPKFKLDFKIIKSIKYLFFFLTLILFKKNIKIKNESRTKVDLILDDVDRQHVVEIFGKILSSYKKPLILTNGSFKNNYDLNNQSIFLDINKSIFSCNILRNKTLKSIKFVFNLFVFSFKKKIDLLKIYFTVFYSAIKYYKIFSIYETNVLLHDRIYHSCAIRNFLFKKKGGKRTVCFQSHIAEGTISVFSDIDILLKFGKEKSTEEKLRLLGGKINSSASIGSLRMEQSLKDHNLLKKIKPIDILISGINIANWVGTSNNMIKDYYEHIKWIAKISKKFPNLKILIKHHPNYRGDAIEDKILKDCSVERIIKSSDGLNSYHYIMKSNFIISFGSTMILEALSLEKKCFFLDPGNKNSTFFENLGYLDKIRISDYKKLEDLITIYLIERKPIDKFDNNIFCLSHIKASVRSCEFLNKLDKS